MTGFALGEVALGSLPNIPLALKVLGAAKTYCRDSLTATANLSARALSVTVEGSSATFNLALRGILHAQTATRSLTPTGAVNLSARALSVALERSSATFNLALRGILYARTSTGPLTPTSIAAVAVRSFAHGAAQLLSATGVVPIVARGLAKLVSSFSPPSMASSIGAHSFFKMSGFPMPSGTTVLPATRTASIVSASIPIPLLERLLVVFSSAVIKVRSAVSFAASLTGAASSSTTARGNAPAGMVGLLAKTIAQASSVSAAVGNVGLASKAVAKAFSGSVLTPAILLFASTLSVSKARARQSLSTIITAVSSARSLTIVTITTQVTAAVLAAFGSAQLLTRVTARGHTTIAAKSVAAVGSSVIASGAVALIGRSASFVHGRTIAILDQFLTVVSTALVRARGNIKGVTSLIFKSSAISGGTASPSGVLGLIGHAASGVKGVATSVLVKSFHATSGVTKTAGAATANFSAAMTVSASSAAKSVNHVAGKVNLLLATTLATAALNSLTGSVKLLGRTRSISQGYASRFLQTLLAAGAAFSRARGIIPPLTIQMASRSLVATFVTFANRPPETIGRPVSGSGGADPVSGEVNNDQVEES